MTIRTPLGRVAAPLIARPDRPVPGFAAGRGPLRREGPAKLTGTALYTDDLVFPGAWYGATVRSTEAHARLLGIDLDPAFDWSTVVVVTAADIPGDEHRQRSIQDDQPILVGRTRSATTRSRSRSSRRPTGHFLGEAAGHVRRPDRAARRRSSTRSPASRSSPSSRSSRATSTAGFAGPTW